MFSAMSAKLTKILKGAAGAGKSTTTADKRESAEKFKQFCLDFAANNDGRRFSGSDDYDAEQFLWSLLDPGSNNAGGGGGGSGDKNFAGVNSENLERIKIFIAAGDTLEEHARKVKEYDDSVMCGFVWSQDYLAYRCRTCARSLSMALCSACFLAGDHRDHDFNMFRSQAGGACDCGDAQVLKESGFCPKHGPDAAKSDRKAPDELFCAFDLILPHVLRCLLLIFSSSDKLHDYEDVDSIYKSAEDLVSLLQMYSDYGAAAKDRLTSIMINQKSYQHFSDGVSHFKDKSDFITKCRENYKNLALKSPESLCTKEDAEVLDCPVLCSELNHVTYLDELMFWLVKLKLPESLLKFLLSLLPCKDYRRPFVDSFAEHYTRMISLVIKDTTTPIDINGSGELIPNRIVHISVQLLSNDLTALYMCEKHKFLRVMVACVYNIVKRCLVECTMHTTIDNFHSVANSHHRLMEGRRYWVATHDLRNALSHKQVALLFLRDPLALELWLDLVSVFQGMYVNIREMNGHVEHEDRGYYHALTAELEMCSFVAHSLLEHLKDESTFDCILSVLQNAISQIQDWFELIQFRPQSCWKPPLLQCCFHIPLHRLYSCFLWRALKLNVPVPFPSETFLRQLIMHPLCIQVVRSEILCDMWVRNGISIRYQSYLYTHSCHAFLDLDIYLLQVCASRINPDWFILTAFERFHLVDWLSFSPIVPVKSFLRTEWEMPMLESCLRLIATMITNYMYLGMTEEERIRTEIAISLFQGDKSYSQLLDSLPAEFAQEHYHTFTSNDIEKLVNELADYVAPQFESGGTMSEGIYIPKGTTWDKYFDPLIVITRCLQTKDFQMALERYQKYLKSKNSTTLNLKSMRIPYRLPDVDRLQPVYANLNRLLHCRTLQAIIYTILLKALRGSAVSENALSLAIFLLELMVHYPNPSVKSAEAPFPSRPVVIDLQYCGWYATGCIFSNLRHKIDRILCVDNVPGLSRSCQEETDQGDFPDLIRLRAKLTNRTSFNNAEMALVSTWAARRSRSSATTAAEIPFIDSSMEVDTFNNESESSDFFYNMTMAYMPARLRRQYFVTDRSSSDQSSDYVDEPEDQDHEASSVAPPGGASIESLINYEGINSPVLDQQPLRALMHEERLAIEGASNDEQHALVVRPANEIAAPSVPSETGGFIDQNMEEDRENSLMDAEKFRGLPGPEPSPRALPQPKIFITNAGHSLLTLLVELHNKLSTDGSRYHPCLRDDVEMTSGDPRCQNFNGLSRIGDNVHFIRQFLNKICVLDNECRRNIEEFCQSLYKWQVEKDAQDKENLEKRRKSAKERQQRLMAQFMSKQKNLFDKLMQKEAAEATQQNQQGQPQQDLLDPSGQHQGFPSQGHEKSAAEILRLAESEYERDSYRTVQCVICNCPASVANDEYPVGLIVSVQSTSVVSKLLASDDAEFKDSDDSNFDTNFEKFTQIFTRGQFEDDLYKILSGKYSTVSCLSYTNCGIRNNGFYVQTCGHYVHCDCHETYMTALQTDAHQRRNAYLQIDKGEFHCPVCRRFSNAILPVYVNNNKICLPTTTINCLQTTPVNKSMISIGQQQKNKTGDQSETGSLIESRDDDEKLCAEITRVLENFTRKKITSKNRNSSKLDEVSRRFLGHFLSQIFRQPWMEDFGLQWQFLCNVLHSNLEIASILKAENLDQGRSCLAELLTLIANQMDSYEDATNEERLKRHELDWLLLIGDSYGNQSAMATAPPTSGDDVINTKNTIASGGAPIVNNRPLATPNNEIPLLCRDPTTMLIRFALIFVHENVALEHFHMLVSSLLQLVTCQICINEIRRGQKSSDHNYIDDNGEDGDENFMEIFRRKYANFAENQIDEGEFLDLQLPFLRLACLLKYYAYQYNAYTGNQQYLSNSIAGSSADSSLLMMSSLKDMNWSDAKFLCNYATGGRHWSNVMNPMMVARDWLLDKAHVLHGVASLKNVYEWIVWRPPHLLPLPATYDPLFRKFYDRRCPNCSRAPKEALLCLLCGQLICGPAEKCCRSEIGGLSEMQRHSADCNSGTGLFLSIHTSLVTISRKRRHAHWGSLYLDAHGEEDRGLKRGRPLFLSRDRLAILRKQWLTHSFDDTCKRWQWTNPPNRFVAGGIIIDN